MQIFLNTNSRQIKNSFATTGVLFSLFLFFFVHSVYIKVKVVHTALWHRAFHLTADTCRKNFLLQSLADKLFPLHPASSNIQIQKKGKSPGNRPFSLNFLIWLFPFAFSLIFDIWPQAT